MPRARRRLRLFLVSLLATAGVVVAACFAVNCLVDPLWYLRGNVLTGINYPFNERLAKMVRLLPRLAEYDCLVLGTSRATLLPEDKIAGHRCFNLAFSDGQAGEYLLYADYLRQRGFAPTLLIVDVRRSDLLGPPQPIEVPDFIRTGSAPPSILQTYLTWDALNFSIRTLRRDGPHHRYYDEDLHAQLEARSKRRWYNPKTPIKPAEPPFDVHPERAAQYVQLRQKFPSARAIAYLPPESAWRIAAFSLTGQLDAYLAAIGTIAAGYDRFIDFSLPSPLTESKDPKFTYDGSHYSRTANLQVAAALTADNPAVGLDWGGRDGTEIAALYRRRLGEFILAADQAGDKTKAEPKGKAEGVGKKAAGTEAD
jgi:hypothetical protein